ncbi:MAG TPA: hypothetical protein VIK18_19445 [Pirellulales bacterium]
MAAAVSWAVLLLELTCLGFVAWYIPMDRQRFMAPFRNFDLELPSVTILMLNIPDLAIWIAAALLAMMSCALQWRLRSKVAAAIFHMLVITFCCVTLVAYRESLFQPPSVHAHGLSVNPAADIYHYSDWAVHSPRTVRIDCERDFWQ